MPLLPNFLFFFGFFFFFIISLLIKLSRKYLYLPFSIPGTTHFHIHTHIHTHCQSPPSGYQYQRPQSVPPCPQVQIALFGTEFGIGISRALLPVWPNQWSFFLKYILALKGVPSSRGPSYNNYREEILGWLWNQLSPCYCAWDWEEERRGPWEFPPSSPDHLGPWNIVRLGMHILPGH